MPMFIQKPAFYSSLRSFRPVSTAAWLTLFASCRLLIAQVPVQYLEKPGVWLLNGSESQYAMTVNGEGQLVHVWWGPRLPAADYGSGAVGAEANNTGWGENSRYLEFPGWGEWHYLEPALKVRFADGVRDLRLRYVSHQIDGDRLSLVLRDSHYPFEVELHYRILPQFDLIERSAVLKNIGDKPADIDQALSALWHLPHLQQWTMTYLAGRWGAETQLRQVNLDQGKFQIESRHGATSHQFNPWFAVSATGQADEQHGEIWFGELAWSGSWKIAAEVNAAGHLEIAGGIHDFDFAWHLGPGESFATPMFVGGFSNAGLGEASRKLHAYQIAEVLPGSAATALRPVIYNSWYATEFNINVGQQIELAKRAKALGVELFVIDDGWFGKRDNDRAGLGDWTPSKTKFPQGLKPLTDAVHGMGMKFGIWVEPEMVNPDSDLYRQHPDWVYYFPNRPRTEQRHQLMLNFARPDVAQHIYSVLDALLTGNDIDFIKWDMNRHIMEPGWMDAPPEQQREMWVRHVLAVYDIIDRLRAKHPLVLWESCSGGGGRADLGILHRTDQVWTSDNTDPLDRLLIQDGYTHAYAPKTEVGWVTDNPDGVNGRSTPLAFRFHTAMLGTLGVGGNLLKWSESEASEAAWYIAEYKQIRPLVQEGRLYRLRGPRESVVSISGGTYGVPPLGGSGNDGFWAFEYVGADQSSAVLLSFLRSSQLGNGLPAIRFQGLKPGARYHVESRQPDKASRAIDTQVLSGVALMERGLQLRMTGDYQSALVRLTQVD
jgi:alpha-galactosidase